MNKEMTFNELGLMPKLQKAIDEMGFEHPTEIQAESIPLIRSGIDVIGRSQTGTGKTMAFAIPAIEKINTHEQKPTVQVIIMCPTRELAQQACEEIKQLTKFYSGICPADIYGGASMERQITKLKRANIVVGTPGRIMDHMRRKTLKLNNVKMVVLDEADEMLSMGFKEDMETILRETPDTRQTILFSATMLPSIMAITKEFQKNPTVVQVNKKQITLDNIKQSYVDVPMGRKTDALKLLLHYYSPSLSIVFCNTKKSADELSEALNKGGFNAEALHGDLKQSQRDAVMDKFRFGSTSILVATDVAARGIDVNDVEFVFNYDVPQNNEYYVHRIGRTGRIGKKGNTVTICSGKRQVLAVREIARAVKSQIDEIPVPTTADIIKSINEKNSEAVEAALGRPRNEAYVNMVNSLSEKGYSLFDIAAAALELNFGRQEIKTDDIKIERKQRGRTRASDFSRIVIDIGRSSRVAPNHLVASITERTMLHGCDIGKIEIYDDASVVSVPSDSAEEVIDLMKGARVCGRPVNTSLLDGNRLNRRYTHSNGRGNDKRIRQNKNTSGSGYKNRNNNINNKNRRIHKRQG